MGTLILFVLVNGVWLLALVGALLATRLVAFRLRTSSV